MNLALWKKAVRDAWLQLAICSAILAAFSWLFVWLMSQLDLGLMAVLLNMMPPWAKSLMGAPVADMATLAGRLGILYVHMVTLLVSIGWAVGRGSDPITGEIGRGTADLILSLPVRRFSILVAPGVVAWAGAFVLAGSVMGGTGLGMLTVDMPESVSLVRFLPGAINLACMVFCLTGVTVFVSSWNRDRWRTIVLSGGFYVVSMIVKIIWRLRPQDDWLRYFTFLSAFQPQMLILDPALGGPLAPAYNLPLIGLGLIAYLVAAIVLSCRDIPTPK